MEDVNPVLDTDPLQRFRFDGKVVLVTGGTGGIGSCFTRAFVGAGASVAVVGRSAEVAAAFAAKFDRPSVIGLGGDLTLPADAEMIVQEVVERFGKIDVLVTAVGGGAGGALHRAELYPQDDWNRIFDLNLRTALLASQAAARSMIDLGHPGRILHISSVRGQIGINAGYSAYVAAKAALNGLTRQQATEWAKHQITVNALAPTFVRTKQVESLLADPTFREALVARIPLGRIAEPDDLVGAAFLLCSDAGTYITGQVVTIDGGLTASQ